MNTKAKAVELQGKLSEGCGDLQKVLGSDRKSKLISG